MTAIGWSTAIKVLGQIFKWSMTVVVIRLLTPSDYGLMAMAMIVVSFLSLFNELGMGDVIVQRKQLGKQLLRQIFGLILAMNLFLFLLLFITSPLIAWSFQEERLTAMVRVLSLDFIIMSFWIIPDALLIRNLDFKTISLIEMAADLIGGLTTLILAYMGHGVWALVVGYLVISSAKAVGQNMAMPVFPRPSFSLKGMGQVLTFGGFLAADRILWFFYSQADIFIIGKMLGKEMLGLYSVARQFAQLPAVKTVPIMLQVGFSAYSKIGDNREEVGFYHLKTIRLLSLLAFPVFFGISSTSPELISVFLGDRWQGASLPMQLISLVMPLQMASTILVPALLGMGRSDIGFRNSLTFSMIMPLACFVGCRWGIVGVSASWVIAFPLAWVIVILLTLSLMGISFSDYLSAMSKPFLGSILMYGAVLGVKGILGDSVQPVFKLGAMIAAGVIAYAVTVFAFNRDGARETMNLFKRARGRRDHKSIEPLAE
jgi:O-antigen/teichoic acid export membrane protein